MFEMFSKSDIQILSFDNATEGDLSLEVYLMVGAFNVLPTRAMLPVQDFAPVTMAAREKRSFYIRMKGPYYSYILLIVLSTYALQKRVNSLQGSGAVFDVMIGAGLTEFQFPEKAGSDPTTAVVCGDDPLRSLQNDGGMQCVGDANGH